MDNVRIYITMQSSKPVECSAVQCHTASVVPGLALLQQKPPWEDLAAGPCWASCWSKLGLVAAAVGLQARIQASILKCWSHHQPLRECWADITTDINRYNYHLYIPHWQSGWWSFWWWWWWLWEAGAGGLKLIPDLIRAMDWIQRQPTINFIIIVFIISNINIIK